MSMIKNVSKPPNMASPLLSGVLFAVIWLAAGALLLSLLLHFSNMKESNLPQYSMFIHGLSAFAGGFVSGKRSGSKGWYYGGLLGLLYGIAILIIGFLAVDSSLSLHSALLLGIVLLTGALGGMIGINIKR